MIKKMMLVVLVGLSLLGLAGCQQEKEYALPDLLGLNKQQTEDLFLDYDLFITLEDKIDNSATRGRFLAYGNELEVGDKVKKNSSIVIYFAVHKNILPNLAGVPQSEILSYFRYMDLVIEIKEFETEDIEAGLFSHYGANLKAGDILESNQSLTIFVAKAPRIILNEIMISKYLEGSLNSRAIELYNHTNNPVDLANYNLYIYTDGDDEVSINIPLTGILEAKKTYLITNTGADTVLLDKADLITKDLVFDGNDMIGISYQDSALIDLLGNIGWGFYTFNNITLVRHANITTPSVTYNINDWGYYKVDYFDILGTHPVTYPTTFTYNPTELLLDYYTQPKGMVQVQFSSNNDGDTAYFTPGFMGEKRVRFVGIDTPEMGSGVIATAAKNFVYNKLNSATEIYIQHDPVSGIYDTYQRHLGLIWYDGVLLNYELVLNGYTQNNYSDTQNRLIFNNIPLAIWMRNAENYAKENRLGVWG